MASRIVSSSRSAAAAFAMPHSARNLTTSRISSGLAPLSCARRTWTRNESPRVCWATSAVSARYARSRVLSPGTDHDLSIRDAMKLANHSSVVSKPSSGRRCLSARLGRCAPEIYPEFGRNGTEPLEGVGGGRVTRVRSDEAHHAQEVSKRHAVRERGLDVKPERQAEVLPANVVG